MNRPVSPFDIKSASITGLALVLKTCSLAGIAAELEVRVSAAGDLFTNAPVLIDVSVLDADGTADTLDLAALVELLRRHTMRAVGIVGATGALLEQAQALGLIEELDIRPRTPRKPPASAPQAAEEAIEDLADKPSNVSATREAPVTMAASPAAPATAGLKVPAMVLDRPLRSGQRVYARGGDLIVLGVVSHGAEVIADGNIHVYGPLRGRAIAGASGDAQARIFAASMVPELISIAGTYRTTDKPLAVDVLGKPAQARLDGDRMLIEPLKS